MHLFIFCCLFFKVWASTFVKQYPAVNMFSAHLFNQQLIITGQPNHFIITTDGEYVDAFQSSGAHQYSYHRSLMLGPADYFSFHTIRQLQTPSTNELLIVRTINQAVQARIILTQGNAFVKDVSLLSNNHAAMLTSNAIIRVNPDLTPVWSIINNFPMLNVLRNIAVDSDDNIVVQGRSNNNNFVQMNSNGTIISATLIIEDNVNLAFSDHASDLFYTTHGIYYAGQCICESIGSQGSDIILYYLNRLGYYQWGLLFGGVGAESNAIVTVSTNYIMLASTTTSFGVSFGSVLITRFDLDGNLQWGRLLPTESSVAPYNIFQVTPTEYVIVIRRSSSHTILIRIDENGHVDNCDQLLDVTNAIKVTPVNFTTQSTLDTYDLASTVILETTTINHNYQPLAINTNIDIICRAESTEVSNSTIDQPTISPMLKEGTSNNMIILSLSLTFLCLSLLICIIAGVLTYGYVRRQRKHIITTSENVTELGMSYEPSNMSAFDALLKACEIYDRRYALLNKINAIIAAKIYEECRYRFKFDKDEVEISGIIDRGNFGETLFAYDIKGKSFVLAKIVRGVQACKNSENEALLHQRVSGRPGIISLLAFGDFTSSQDDIRYVHFLEYANFGKSNHLARKLQHLSNPEMLIMDLATQLIWALVFLEQANVYHADIKGPNVVISLTQELDKYKLHIKIIDYGCAQLVESVTHTDSGDVSIFSLQRVNFHKSKSAGLYTKNEDVWAAGLLLLELATGTNYAYSFRTADLIHNSSETSESEYQTVYDTLPLNNIACQELITLMLTISGTHRPKPSNLMPLTQSVNDETIHQLVLELLQTSEQPDNQVDIQVYYVDGVIDNKRVGYSNLYPTVQISDYSNFPT